MDEDAAGLLEWWRVADFERATNRRMLFVEEEAATDFARHLVDESGEQVLLEHWRNGDLIGLRLVVHVLPN